jgi:hypothetical protein
MKRNKLNFVFAGFLLGANILFAQSDYETIREFKEKAQQIEQKINNAASLNELAEAYENIEVLKDDFISHKDLIDKALYPDNFYKTIMKLNNFYAFRKEDFTKIEILQSEVSGLKMYIDTLDRRNMELASQFEEIERQNRNRISQLESSIAQLKSSLQKRDQIVMNMIDSLIPASFITGADITPEEKKEVLSEAERSNVLAHIKRAVNDNVRFLDATRLYPDDIREIKSQQEKFMGIWKNIGPAMVEVYADKKKNPNELKEIDHAFALWNTRLYEEVWESLNEEFADRNVYVDRFTNGIDFTSAVNSYIDIEIKKAKEGSESDSKEAHKTFVAGLWYEEVVPAWIPFMMENKMLAEEQLPSIEAKISLWSDEVYPGGFNWLYIVIGMFIIAIVAFLLTRKPARQTEESTVPRKQSL